MSTSSVSMKLRLSMLLSEDNHFAFVGTFVGPWEKILRQSQTTTSGATTTGKRSINFAKT
eukprot:4047031-Amphidinium_carterae.1